MRGRNGPDSLAGPHQVNSENTVFRLSDLVSYYYQNGHRTPHRKDDFFFLTDHRDHEVRKGQSSKHQIYKKLWHTTQTAAGWTLAANRFSWDCSQLLRWGCSLASGLTSWSCFSDYRPCVFLKRQDKTQGNFHRDPSGRVVCGAAT